MITCIALENQPFGSYTCVKNKGYSKYIDNIFGQNSIYVLYHRNSKGFDPLQSGAVRIDRKVFPFAFADYVLRRISLLQEILHVLIIFFHLFQKLRFIFSL